MPVLIAGRIIWSFTLIVRAPNDIVDALVRNLKRKDLINRARKYGQQAEAIFRRLGTKTWLKRATLFIRSEI